MGSIRFRHLEHSRTQVVISDSIAQFALRSKANGFKLRWITAAHNLFLCLLSAGMFLTGFYAVWEKGKVVK